MTPGSKPESPSYNLCPSQLSSEVLLFDFILSWRLQKKSIIGTLCPRHTLAGLKHAGFWEKFSALWEGPGWEVRYSSGSMSWAPRRRKDDFPNHTWSSAKLWGFLSFAGSVRIQVFQTYWGWGTLARHTSFGFDWTWTLSWCIFIY